MEAQQRKRIAYAAIVALLVSFFVSILPAFAFEPVARKDQQKIPEVFFNKDALIIQHEHALYVINGKNLMVFIDMQSFMIGKNSFLFKNGVLIPITKKTADSETFIKEEVNTINMMEEIEYSLNTAGTADLILTFQMFTVGKEDAADYSTRTYPFPIFIKCDLNKNGKIEEDERWTNQADPFKVPPCYCPFTNPQCDFCAKKNLIK